MNSDRPLLAYARDIIEHRLVQFVHVAQISAERRDVHELDLAELATAAWRSLAALSLFEAFCPDTYATRTQTHLREASRIARGITEVRFLLSLLKDLRDVAGTGRHIVGARADLRISRYSKQLVKLRQRMVEDRFTELTFRLVEKMHWSANGPEPKLVDFARAAILDAQDGLSSTATDLDTSNLTVVHELWTNLQGLSDTVEMFQDVLRHDAWQSIETDIGDLRRCVTPVINSSSAKMRCTAWLEQARDAQEIAALRSLIALAREQTEHAYVRLAACWNAQRASELNAKFERVLKMPSTLL